MTKHAFALFALAALTGNALAAQDHDAAPMMVEPKAPLTEQAHRDTLKPAERQGQADAIVAAFRQRFEQPRIAVFWNNALPGRVSDWHGQHRGVIARRAQLAGQADGEAVDLNGQADLTAQAESRDAPTDQRGDEVAFDLQDGLISTFQEGGARMVDQRLAQRLTDNALEDGTFARLSPDQARLQMRALAEHADYVMELTANTDSTEKPRYRVRVLSTRDASVLATFTTTGEPPESQREHTWVATSKGYQKREAPLSLTEVGRELALRTMEKMRAPAP